MKTSRSLDDLHPRVKVKALIHLSKCKDAGIDLLIYCTLRDNEMQAALYAQGRTVKGWVVTNAKAGDSGHNYGLAYDCVPLRGGKPVWGNLNAVDAKLWAEVGRLGEESGLSWAGRWTGKLRETAHFEDFGGLTIAQLKANAGVLT